MALPVKLSSGPAPYFFAVVTLALIPRVLEPFQTILLGYGLTIAIAALGFNLLLGYTGLLSFGHAAYFGVGAYSVGMLMRYYSVYSIEVLLLAALVTSAAVSAAFGILCVRHTRIFFGILTLALGQLLWSLAFKFYYITGGSDGIRVPTPMVLGVNFGESLRKLDFLVGVYYYYVLAIFAVCLILMYVIVQSPFGRSLQAIRDSESRAQFVGIKVRRYRWYAFVISGIFAGVGGALWAPLNGHAGPEVLHWLFSGEIVFLTLLGGFRKFWGPIVGAIIFNFLKAYAIGLTAYWQLVLGAVLVLMVLAMPTGLAGGIDAVAKRFR